MPQTRTLSDRLDSRSISGAYGAARRGMTLFELILVVAIIVVIAAIAAPTLQQAFKTQRLKKSADLVRAEWGRAKVNAIRNGEEFAFFWEPETGVYWVAPFSSVYAGQSPDTTQEAISNYDYGNGLLPRGVVFDSGESSEDARAQVLADGEGADGNANMILFYPDGTTQDAQIFLRNEKDLYVRVSLRALTGVSSVSDVMSKPEEVPQ